LGTCYEEFYEPIKDFDPDKLDEYCVDVPSDAENLDQEVYNWVEDLLENYYNDTSPRRVIVKGKNPVCTHGYAVTQRGARRLLLEMNDWMPFPVDITMIHYIDEERIKAYSVLPPVFVQWRNTQDPRKNSDIEGEGIELARNWGILRSARKHLVDWYLPLFYRESGLISGSHQVLEGIDGGMETRLETIRREILCESHTCNKTYLDLKHDKE
jgi:hypothetical protein